MKKIYFRHMTTTDGRRFTVAGQFPTNTTVGEINIGISLCGDRDNFSRKDGRNRAGGRSLSSSNHGRASENFVDIGGTVSDCNEALTFYTITKPYESMSTGQLKEKFNLLK